MSLLCHRFTIIYEIIIVEIYIKSGNLHLFCRALLVGDFLWNTSTHNSVTTESLWRSHNSTEAVGTRFSSCIYHWMIVTAMMMMLMMTILIINIATKMSIGALSSFWLWLVQKTKCVFLCFYWFMAGHIATVVQIRFHGYNLLNTVTNTARLWYRNYW